MKVFKFGGASVKDAEGVRNLAAIVGRERGELVVVVSAMGKTTNLLETLCNAYFYKQEEAAAIMGRLREYHLVITRELFPVNDGVFRHLEELFAVLEAMLAGESSMCYDYEYDRIVSFGELLSTTIVNFPPLWPVAPTWASALDRAVSEQPYIISLSYAGAELHQYPLYLSPLRSCMVISDQKENDVSVCLPVNPCESII